MAHRDLYGREDDADWISGILGIRVARAPGVMAIFEVDGGDGTVCPSQAEEFVRFAPRPFRILIANSAVSSPQTKDFNR